MRFSYLCWTALLPFSLAGCRSVVSAQPNTSLTAPVTSVASNASGASNGLAVSISCLESSTVYPGSNLPQREISNFFSPDDPHIDVVLSNISAKPISIHQEWNSWGYYNLSLEITKIDGKLLAQPIIVKREGGEWTKNFPESQTIAPGESIVREVHFPPSSGQKIKAFLGGGYYSHFPPKPRSYAVYTMRAVFQDSRRDKEQYAPPAWTGKATSRPMEYLFR